MSKKQTRDQILGHSEEADGIDEYDNPMPGWWLGLFYLTILWGVGYGIHYHFIADRSQTGRLAAEMVAADDRWPAAAAAQAEFVTTDAAVAQGEVVFSQNCASCHGPNLEGGIGPNLVDEEWIHGSSPEEVIATITNGVLDKGMLAWGPILGAEAINQVTAYVLSKSATEN